MIEAKTTNTYRNQTTITRADRERLLGHRRFTLWSTGHSASGKSTLANATEKALHERGFLTYVLDGDNIRHGLNKDLGFLPDDRAENARLANGDSKSEDASFSRLQ